jgi:hypothetical protein
VLDLKTQAERVLKILVATTPGAQQQFHREIKTLASLAAPSFPRVGQHFHLEVGDRQRRVLCCLILEKIEGQTLLEALQQYPNGCPEVTVMNWLRQAVTILTKLHSQHILHGNLKPANLILRRGTRCLAIADWGDGGRSNQVLAQTESTGALSEGYSPPEQIRGQPIGTTADFYALGRICIHLLTGQHPFKLEDPRTGRLHWRCEVQVNLALADLLDRMVQPEVSKRPPSGAEVQIYLSQMLETAPSPQAQPQAQAIQSRPQPQPAASAASHQYVRGTTRTRSTSSGTRTERRRDGLLRWDSHEFGYTPARTQARFTGVFVGLVKWQGELAKTLLITLRMTAWGTVGGGLAAALGFWLTYWSPLTTYIDAFFAHQLPSPHVPLVLQPAMIVFGLAGLGTVWGLTQTQNAEIEQLFWTKRWQGMLGYTLGWLSWQLITSGITIPQAIARLTAILSLGLLLSIGYQKNFLIGAGITGLGTPVIFSALIHSHLWQPNLFLNFFRSAAEFIPDEPNLWAAVTFFALMGGSFGFWLGISYYVVDPVVSWVSRFIKSWWRNLFL